MQSTLSSILDKSADNSAIPFFVTDLEGNLQTESAGFKTYPLRDNYNFLKAALRQVISSMGHTQEPIIIDITFEQESRPVFLKVFMWSLMVNASAPNVLWSGWFFDEESNPSSSVIEGLPLLTNADKRNLYDKMQLCHTECSSFLSAVKKGLAQSDKFKFLLEQATEKQSIKDLLVDATSKLESVDLAGLALWNNQQLEVKYSSDYVLVAKKLSFMSGEGYIGKVFATGLEESWRIDPLDPRGRVFFERGLSLNMVYCFPVFYEAERLGVLFMGSNHSTGSKEALMELGKEWAKIIGIRLQLHELMDKEQLHSFQLSALMEMVRNYDYLNDKRAISALLLDIATTVLQTQACLIYYPGDHTNEVEILESRGLSLVDFNLYAKDLQHRLKVYESKPNKYPEIKETVLNKKMFEYVLWNEQRHQAGMIAFTYERSGGDFLYNYLKLIGRVTNMALNRISREAAFGDRADLLFESLLTTNPDYYKLISQCLDLLSFLHKKDPDLFDLKRLTATAKMIPFPHALVQKAGSTELLLNDLIDYQDIKEKNCLKLTNPIASLIYLTISYFCTDAKTGFFLDFQTHYPDSEWVQWVLEGIQEWEAGKTDRRNNPVSQEATQEDLIRQLTNREWEILDMLAHGLKNHDISRILYISDNTVKNHISNLYKKLQIKNRSQATSLFFHFQSHQKEAPEDKVIFK